MRGRIPKRVGQMPLCGGDQFLYFFLLLGIMRLAASILQRLGIALLGPHLLKPFTNIHLGLKIDLAIVIR